MLIVSREAFVKVGRHAWNAYPLQAAGYLLGSKADRLVYAALPCSKDCRRTWRGDDWMAVSENIELARSTAREFDLDVVGLYASTRPFEPAMPRLPQHLMSSAGLMLSYQAICCPRCSSGSFEEDGRCLAWGRECVIQRGKRFSSPVNQQRILKMWRQLYGTSNYDACLTRHQE